MMLSDFLVSATSFLFLDGETTGYERRIVSDDDWGNDFLNERNER